MILIEEGLWEAARVSPASVLEIDPKHAAGHYFLAVGLLAIDRVAEARDEVSRAMGLGYRPRPEFLRSLERAEKAQITKSRSPEAEAEGGAKEE